MDHYANRLVDWLIDIKVVTKESREVYFFGLRQGILYAINILTCVIIGGLTNNYWGVFIYILAYTFLRSYAGGYHAETELGCYLTSTAIILSAALLINQFELSPLMFILMNVGTTIVIMLLAPVEDHHKPLDDSEQLVYTHRLRVILGIELILIISTMLMRLQLVMEAATLGYTTVGVVVLLGWIKNQIREKQ